MIKRLARHILRSELSSLNSKIESLNENNDILRADCEGIKDIKLRLRVAEMYIDDDAAIDELLAEKKNIELQSKDYLRSKLTNSPRFNDRSDYAFAQLGVANQMAARQRAAGQAGVGNLLGCIY